MFTDVYYVMLVYKDSSVINHQREQKRKRGSGFVNSRINKLPFELHIPDYQYCGPGTKLEKRLQRSDPGINELDKHCRRHDIAYRNSSDLLDRHKADLILQKGATKRVQSQDTSLREKKPAWIISNTMKTKRRLGMGIRLKKEGNSRRRSKVKEGKSIRRRSNTHLRKHRKRVIPPPAALR
ncbi:hypothetical protein NQ315_012309 [Exocentrus adspersus]|uniref:Phospholipase A2-like domain-containing protein n=1 Tax=Exocentrus adspersus TaxID=1586481 RepID=A0AAV8VCL2_9CUCU|nr:hypothetical protein NQ315_012309 [Exocentrus adspersus]